MAIKKTAGSKTTAGKKSAPLDPKVADKLLDLLSTDNEFRRLFKKDPQAAVSRLGHDPSTSMVCASVKTIAPKREFATIREELKTHLVTQGVFTVPHCFEAGKVALNLRRK